MENQKQCPLCGGMKILDGFGGGNKSTCHKCNGTGKIEIKRLIIKCDDCGIEITKSEFPSDGWQLEDGRTVCSLCCSSDLRKIASNRCILRTSQETPLLKITITP